MGTQFEKSAAHAALSARVLDLGLGGTLVAFVFV